MDFQDEKSEIRTEDGFATRQKSFFSSPFMETGQTKSSIANSDSTETERKPVTPATKDESEVCRTTIAKSQSEEKKYDAAPSNTEDVAGVAATAMPITTGAAEPPVDSLQPTSQSLSLQPTPASQLISPLTSEDGLSCTQPNEIPPPPEKLSPVTDKPKTDMPQASSPTDKKEKAAGFDSFSLSLGFLPLQTEDYGDLDILGVSDAELMVAIGPGAVTTVDATIESQKPQLLEDIRKTTSPISLSEAAARASTVPAIVKSFSLMQRPIPASDYKLRPDIAEEALPVRSEFPERRRTASTRWNCRKSKQDGCIVPVEPMSKVEESAENKVISNREFMETYEQLKHRATLQTKKNFAKTGFAVERILILRNPHPPHDTLLKFALSRNNIDTFLFILKLCPKLLGTVDDEGCTEAHEAALKNLPEALKAIHKKKHALLNQLNRARYTPLSLAVKMIKYNAVVYLSSQRGISWMSCEVPGLSVIAEAVRHMCVSAAAAAVRADYQPVSPILSQRKNPPSGDKLAADKKNLNKECTRPTVYTHIEILEILLKHTPTYGININTTAADGSGTVLHQILLTLRWKRERNPSTFFIAPKAIHAVTMLAEYKAIDLEATDINGKTALQLSDAFGFSEISRILHTANQSKSIKKRIV